MQVYANQLHQHLQGPLQPVYLVFGDDDFLRFQALSNIRERARQLGFEERIQFNQQQDFSWADLTHEGQSLSLFSALRIIELELPTAAPGTEGSKALQSWVDVSPPDTLLILHGPKLKSEQQRGKWFKRLTENGVFVPVYTPENAQLARFIQSQAQSFQLKLDDDAIGLLREWFEGNLLALHQTLQKLSLHFAPQQQARVSIDDIRQHAELQSRFDIFSLQEPLLQSNLNTFLQRLQRLLETDAEPALIHWLMQRHCHTLHQAYVLTQQGLNTAQALQKQGVWKNQQGAYASLLKAWNHSIYQQASHLLWRIELAYKRDSKEDFATLVSHLALLLCYPQQPINIAPGHVESFLEPSSP